MKVELCYNDNLRITVHGHNGESWDYSYPIKDLDDAMLIAQQILDDDTNLIDGTAVTEIFVTSGRTGEIIAICTPDDDYEDDDDDEDSYDDGDWDYNEDMGYDPYLGYYSDDC